MVGFLSQCTVRAAALSTVSARHRIQLNRFNYEADEQCGTFFQFYSNNLTRGENLCKFTHCHFFLLFSAEKCSIDSGLSEKNTSVDIIGTFGFFPVLNLSF